jgi:hypothetical protein
MADGGVKGGAKRKVDLCGKGCMPMMPVCVQGFSVQNSNKDLVSNLEFPYEVIIRKIFVTALTAPGGSDTYIVTVGDGTNNETVTLTGSETENDTKTGTAHVAKDTNITVNLATSTTGSNDKAVDILIYFQPCAEFNDVGQ